jgi:hypothetical protein
MKSVDAMMVKNRYNTKGGRSRLLDSNQVHGMMISATIAAENFANSIYRRCPVIPERLWG